jgi:hypothetical protein
MSFMTGSAASAMRGQPALHHYLGPALDGDEQHDDRLRRVMHLEGLLPVLVFEPCIVALREDGLAERGAIDRSEFAEWYADVHALLF